MSNGKRRSTPKPKGLLEALEASFNEALRSPEGMVEPVALLWIDSERQWAPLIPRLRVVLPHIYILGDYKPEAHTGPVIWLRCIIDRTLPDVSPSENVTPILYLPGITRQQLRSGDDCPKLLQPLVELQYRGRVWNQRNGRDWTVEAFLSSEDGLGLDVAQDDRTRESMLRALPLLADTPLDALKGRRLEADDFDRLAVTDPIRDLLRWMSIGDAFRTGEDASRWPSFCSVCRSEFNFDPDKKSPSDAAASLIEGLGKWKEIWERFCESPKLYPGISQLLRDLTGQLKIGFALERLPQLNDKAEAELRGELVAVANLPQAKAIEKVLALEEEHAKRRQWVWAQLGESPLAMALAPLSRLAVLAKTPVGGATLDLAIQAYTTEGWKCDLAALESMAAVRSAMDTPIVLGAVRALYGTWLDTSARHFQSLVLSNEQAARSRVSSPPQEKDVCVLFADGLRFDVAGMLKERLEARGLKVQLGHRLAPFPTVTATAKPVATIAADAFQGSSTAEDFLPQFKGSSQTYTAQRLRDEMTKRGADILNGEVRAPKSGISSAWAEAGRLDELGHSLGVRLVSQIEIELESLVERIASLLEHGWGKLRVVTDHGWLLLPGNLPKVELPSSLVATKWARCALLRGETEPNFPVYGWYWNPQARIASPPGITCFTLNNEYTHGGVSPQECIVPELIVERGGAAVSASITNIQWRGMRCRVSVTTNDPSVIVDLRLNWKQSISSIAASPKEVGAAGEVSLAVADDSHEGAAATVVVYDAAGNVLDRKSTTVGEV